MKYLLVSCPRSNMSTSIGPNIPIIRERIVTTPSFGNSTCFIAKGISIDTYKTGFSYEPKEKENILLRSTARPKHSQETTCQSSGHMVGLGWLRGLYMSEIVRTCTGCPTQSNYFRDRWLWFRICCNFLSGYSQASDRSEEFPIRAGILAPPNTAVSQSVGKAIQLF